MDNQQLQPQDPTPPRAEDQSPGTGSEGWDRREGIRGEEVQENPGKLKTRREKWEVLGGRSKNVWWRKSVQ